MGSYHPAATYRLQFHEDFTFRDAAKAVSYLAKLGIRTLYASPVFQAAVGSAHGYDVTVPDALNKALGDEEDLSSLIAALHRRKMGWLQDVVPNHMSFSTENPWIADLLTRGRSSSYYGTFDLYDDHPDEELRRGIMFPFLGKPVGQVIWDGEMTLQIGRKGFFFSYYSHVLPVSMEALPAVLETGMDNELPSGLLDLLHGEVDADRWEMRMEELFGDYERGAELSGYLDRCLDRINADPELIRLILSRLSYLPVHWKETEQRINYRRFFTINGLICLNIQDPAVFERYHRRIGEWVNKGWFDGLRIDHIDGLYDPAAYLARIRELCGGRPYVVVEKILEKEEELPERWPVDGTTGYEFLAQVNNLLTRKENKKAFLRHYSEWIASELEAESFFVEKKRFILHHRMKGELDLLVHQCMETGWFEGEPEGREKVREALAEFMVHFPVYRLYEVPSTFGDAERELIESVFSHVSGSGRDDPEFSRVLGKLKKMWLGSSLSGPGQSADVDHLFRRIMQYTGPLMAKGLEDTAYYAFAPFLAHNEVGDSPDYFGISLKEFHRKMIRRREAFPRALNTLSTHDTKRGEDARARLQVLSSLPGVWIGKTTRWHDMNLEIREESGAPAIPSKADEYLIYQSLVAHLPMEGRIDDPLIERFRDFLLKALREAKENTSWSEPDPRYEELTLSFAGQILRDDHSFRKELEEFAGEIIPHGMIHSITQTLLKLTAPGVPDTYQGCETWNLSFVDPDNRRPVDFRKLSRDLDRMIRKAGRDKKRLMEELWKEKESGRVKQWVTHLALKLRNADPDLFDKGSYLPLEVKGRHRQHVIAFIRQYHDSWLLVALPLHSAGMPEEHRWEKTRIVLPEMSPVKWKHLLTGETYSQDGDLPLKKLFRTVPFALCNGIPNQPVKRAGILMHVSSLPGPFGTGDFGRGAFDFIDFLHRSGQQYWQILPLSVTSALTHHSPYGSESAFAGNTHFIDPSHLADSGLLQPDQFLPWKLPETERADYPAADRIKRSMLDLAFARFRRDPPAGMKERFAEYRERESYWLRDYALYRTLKNHFGGRPWFEWPAVYRNRKAGALSEFSRHNAEPIDRIQFEQFIFSEQWARIKEYAHEKGIRIFGDIPIYIDRDSSDLWAHPHLFLLNPDGSPKALAGVPPDYFNEEGQLWGMPLYDWDAMEQENYRWWITRLEKNLQWYDLLRLDHFRGFEAYWEVPTGERTAKNGRWIRGPGEKLFDAIQRRFPHMPFVAEDLGQITQEVYDLRDKYGLPGMKVVQFGFGDHMAFSHHYPGNIPYRSIAYTGTHDNNTMKGWFRKEADRATLKRYRSYTGNKLKEKNVHREMIRLAYGSPARLVVVPIQDWLGLDEQNRMNFPSTITGNWLWRADRDQLTQKLEKQIRKSVKIFGRY